MENEIQQQTTEKRPSTFIEKLTKNKKVGIAAAILLIAAIVGIIILALTSTPSKTTTVPSSNTTKGPIHLGFLTETVSFTGNSSEKTVDFIISSSVPVSGVLLHLDFDPRYIEITKFNLNNSDGGLFGKYVQIVQLALNEPPGRATVSLVLPKEISERAGNGSIGAFTIRVKNLPATESTSIKVSPDSSLVSRTGAKTPYTTTPLVITR